MNRLLRFLTVIGIISLASPVFAFHFDYDTTDNNASILIRNATLISRHWGENDEIGLFTPTGLCAGGIVVTEFPVGLPAWGDDAFTDSIDGFRSGEQIRFVGWDASEQQEFQIGVLLPVEGDTVWRSDELMVCELAESGVHFRPSPTFFRHRILCTSARISMDDESVPLEDFDQIGILTPNGVVAGMMVWDATIGQAVGYAFTDDAATNDRVEGFRAGESFRFLFYRNASRVELEPNRIRFTRGDTTFVASGASSVELEHFSSDVGAERTLPLEFAVEGPYPNPFNGRGQISLYLPQETDVHISVVDIEGRLVMEAKSRRYSRGEHRVSVDFSNLSAGNYLCRVSGGGESRDLRFVLIK